MICLDGGNDTSASDCRREAPAKGLEIPCLFPLPESVQKSPAQRQGALSPARSCQHQGGLTWREQGVGLSRMCVWLRRANAKLPKCR